MALIIAHPNSAVQLDPVPDPRLVAIAERTRTRWSEPDIERDNARLWLADAADRYTLPPLEATARLCALFGADVVEGWLAKIRAMQEGR